MMTEPPLPSQGGFASEIERILSRNGRQGSFSQRADAVLQEVQLGAYQTLPRTAEGGSMSQSGSVRMSAPEMAWGPSLLGHSGSPPSFSSVRPTSSRGVAALLQGSGALTSSPPSKPPSHPAQAPNRPMRASLNGVMSSMTPASSGKHSPANNAGQSPGEGGKPMLRNMPSQMRRSNESCPGYGTDPRMAQERRTSDMQAAWATPVGSDSMRRRMTMPGMTDGTGASISIGPGANGGEYGPPVFSEPRSRFYSTQASNGHTGSNIGSPMPSSPAQQQQPHGYTPAQQHGDDCATPTMSGPSSHYHRSPMPANRGSSTGDPQQQQQQQQHVAEQHDPTHQAQDASPQQPTRPQANSNSFSFGPTAYGLLHDGPEAASPVSSIPGSPIHSPYGGAPPSSSPAQPSPLGNGGGAPPVPGQVLHRNFSHMASMRSRAPVLSILQTTQKKDQVSKVVSRELYSSLSLKGQQEYLKAKEEEARLEEERREEAERKEKEMRERMQEQQEAEARENEFVVDPRHGLNYSLSIRPGSSMGRIEAALVADGEGAAAVDAATDEAAATTAAPLGPPGGSSGQSGLTRQASTVGVGGRSMNRRLSISQSFAQRPAPLGVPPPAVRMSMNGCGVGPAGAGAAAAAAVASNSPVKAPVVPVPAEKPTRLAAAAINPVNAAAAAAAAMRQQQRVAAGAAPGIEPGMVHDNMLDGATWQAQQQALLAAQQQAQQLVYNQRQLQAQITAPLATSGRATAHGMAGSPSASDRGSDHGEDDASTDREEEEPPPPPSESLLRWIEENNMRMSVKMGRAR